MARLNSRRSRLPESDDEDASRESTPVSTIPGDRKRIRPSVDSNTRPSASPGHVQPRMTPTAGRLHVEGDRKFVLHPKRMHQPGAIVRVKLTNFVTYTSAEFFPGPSLNMVIGPNGTGKSTLVCAICLGLGWPPQLLGRAKDPSEFVKHGCKEATIEIELQRYPNGPKSTKNNPIIVRKIKKEENKSSYAVNDNQATNKAVQLLVKDTFNIQVDNLCQFLPQDRVVEFAQLDPVQMLETTLRAAGDPKTRGYHTKLKDLRQGQQDLLSSNKSSRETLDNLEKRQESQQSEVERLKERQIVQRQIEWLEKCRPLPQYQHAKQKAQELNIQKRKLGQEKQQLQQESEPALRKVNAKQQYAQAAEENRNNSKREVKRAENELNRINQQIARLDEIMKDCDTRVAAEKASTNKERQSLQQRRVELQSLKNRKSNEPERIDTRAMNEKIQDHTSRVRELQQKGEDLQTEMNAQKTRGSEKQNKKKLLEEKLKSLDTQEGKQESKLEKLSNDTYRAWQWIKNNQQRFKKEVFGPPVVTCTVRDPQMASPVEATLQRGDFKIITAQCREDFNILQDELTKKQRLFDVSIRVCTLTDLSSFRPALQDDQLRRLGLDQWAVDCLEGPPTVLAMLCQERFLHQTAIASNDISQEQHDRIAASVIKTYIAGDKSVRFTRRHEYVGAGAVAKVGHVRPAAMWTNQPVDVGRKDEIGEQIRQLNRDIHEIREAMESIKKTVKEVVREKEEEDGAASDLRVAKEAKQKALTEWNGLDAKISQAEDRIRRCETTISTVHDRCVQILKEKDTAMFQKADLVLQYCSATHVLKELGAKLLEAEVVAIEAQSDSEVLQRVNKHIRDTLEVKIRELAQATKDFDIEKAKAENLKGQVLSLKKDAEKLVEEQNEHGLIDLLTEIANSSTTEQDLEARLDSENARLELNAGSIDAANTLRDFEKRAREIERLRSQFKDFNTRQTEFHNAIAEIRVLFERDVEPIIEQIDAAFAESFARIGCAGQVALHKASSADPLDCTEDLGGQENGLDFANWAIHISVKFRESEPLQLLDSHRQSGGERAVSTIFYLMALQSLSRSPFRVVDEINQGMDPRNERMVHGRMVDIAAAANQREEAGDAAGGSQYFLITPKLLSGLKYEKGMTVLCIVSGENMPSATDVKRVDEEGQGYIEKGRTIDFGDCARRARHLGFGLNISRGADLSDRRTDSGVGMRVSAAA